MRNRIALRALIVLALLAGLGVLLGSGTVSHDRKPSLTLHPVLTPTPQAIAACPTPHQGFVVVFSHLAGSTTASLRCFQLLPKTDPVWSEQVLATPLTGVYEACTGGSSAFVSYASHQNPARQNGPIEVTGHIDLFVPAGTCRAIRTLGVASMTITSVTFVSSFDGEAEPEAHLIHQVVGEACSERADFFTVWYDGGQQKACFANFGLLHLPTPLTGVVKVCAGNNRGEAFSLRGLYSGIEMGFGFHQCGTPAYLFGIAHVSLNAIDIG